MERHEGTRRHILELGSAANNVLPLVDENHHRSRHRNYHRHHRRFYREGYTSLKDSLRPPTLNTT